MAELKEEFMALRSVGLLTLEITVIIMIII